MYSEIKQGLEKMNKQAIIDLFIAYIDRKAMEDDPIGYIAARRRQSDQQDEKTSPRQKASQRG